MVRLTTACYAAVLSAVDGARLKMSMQEDLQAFSMIETIAAAGGMMNMTQGGQINKACESEIWSKELSPLFTERRVVGSGATACVWLGKDSTGTLVAIKVGKNSGGKGAEAALASWSGECRDMQMLRFDACENGKEMLALHEAYVPTCTGVGPTKGGGAYYIMHAAGTTGFKTAPEEDWSVEQRKGLFAQFVASMYALHEVGQTHNDLHGENIVVDKGGHMALIDFGELKSPDKSWVEGYKRDGNAIWRWAEVLAKCPQGELWATSFDQGYLMPAVQSATKKCLSSNWGVGADFLKVFTQMTDNGMDKILPHMITELYQTKFVQNNVPASKSLFAAEFAKGCLGWNAAKRTEMMLRKQFEDHFKCDTVPTFMWTKISVKKGKTRKRQVQQCGGLQGGCFSLEKSDGKTNVWQCEGASITRGSNCGDFPACLTSAHKAYAYTKSFTR